MYFWYCILTFYWFYLLILHFTFWFYILPFILTKSNNYYWYRKNLNFSEPLKIVFHPYKCTKNCFWLRFQIQIQFEIFHLGFLIYKIKRHRSFSGLEVTRRCYFSNYINRHHPEVLWVHDLNISKVFGKLCTIHLHRNL